MKQMNLRSSLLIGLLLLTGTLMGQTKKSFTLDDLMWGGSNYWNLQPKNLYTAFWGPKLLQLEVDAVKTCTDEQGKRVKAQTLFTAADVKALINDGTKGRGLNLMQASFPYPDKTLALLQTNRSNLLYDWKKKAIVWQAERDSVRVNEEFNIPSRSEVYAKDFDLYLRTADGKAHRITTDGSKDIVYGQAVHRDEFGIKKGAYFSPSGQLLAYYRMDQSMVEDYPLVDIFTREAKLDAIKYPMAGMTSHKVTVGIYNPKTEQTVWLQAGDPTDRYFTNISWAPDEKTIYMIEMPRSQKKTELVAYDVATGQRKGVLYTETHEKYVHPMHPLTFLPWDSSKFIYQSEKDGYNHLYLFDTKGKELKQITKGEFVVLDLVGFNTKTKSVIIQSNEAHPLHHNYYAVNIDNGKRTLLDNGKGTHRAMLSPDGTMLFDRWSEPDVFRKIAVRNTATASATLLQTDASPWQAYNVPEISSGSLTAADGHTKLFYRLVKPVNFDPNKKYPTVVYVYGGPGVRNVDASWNYAARPWEIYMAQKGYVIFVLDNRGSSERGFAFETATYHRLGQEEMKDQMRGVDYLKSLPYVDANRIGVHGWSYGGFMTTSLITNYPDVFKVGVAGGPVIDWKYYEVMYGERYMGTPQENPEGYAQSSLLNKAKDLKGRLQIIIGYNDPVCVPQHSLAFLRACEDAGTQPDFFTYPGQGHNMMGKDMVHLHERITRYFEDYLK
ncbi:DPP IV N-terminal domain-containing protein [uncultured Alloprevotella sp.]|uniref:S9 family peptidase n=1 Tax=uncultured Alloprevotella sp. TaxID=1283315 RepID=UPI00263120A1|nr:DPP IV N-terminal domain-containing protein [uncultured Alloprevotella sp.]